jgi:hypothetical protein
MAISVTSFKTDISFQLPEAFLIAVAGRLSSVLRRDPPDLFVTTFMCTAVNPSSEIGASEPSWKIPKRNVRFQ